MDKIFIDCGYYVGKVHEIYREAGILDDTWTVHAFEANPQLDIPDWVERKAVWTEDGEVTFQIGGRHDASSIQGTSGHGEPELVTVPSFDFSKWISELPDAYILCSMDIEGAEFPVLRKMLEENTINKINYLDVEFHHRLMEKEDSNDARDIIRQLLNRGVGVRIKVPLE